MSFSADANAVSARPVIQGFQLDSGAVGDIARAVNMFRGDVNIPLTLTQLTGQNGLAITVTAFYGSNVVQAARTWNAAAPTSVLGLGWSFEGNRIFVEGKNTGEPTDGVYILQWGGTVDRLIWCGEENDGVVFQSRLWPLWQIRYSIADGIWRVTTDTGTVAVFGSARGQGDSLVLGVRWGNWIGSTRSPAPPPSEYMLAWNLAEVQSPWRDSITYRWYNDNYLVVPGGSYTRASYLAEISDMLGQRVRFNYREKEQFEYVVPHTLTDGSADPAYQDRYETLYLSSLDVLPPGVDEPQYSIVFDYSFANVSGHAGDQFTKRLLRSVTQETRGLRALPPMRFDYNLDPARPGPGALARVTFPEGGTAEYGYEILQLNDGSDDDIFKKNIEVTNPIRGSRPTVWHGPGYVVIAWYSASKAMTQIDVYTFGGRWSKPWSATFQGRLSLADCRAGLHGEFFALYLAPDSATAPKLRIFRRNGYRFGEWRVWEFSVGTSALAARSETALGVGNDFVVFHLGGDVGVNRWTYDRITQQWQRETHSHGTEKVCLAAGDDFYIAGYHSDVTQSATYQIFYRDVAGTWEAGPVGAATGPFPWRPAYGAGLWSTGSNFAVATFFPANETEPKLRILMWDAVFGIVGDVTVQGGGFGTRVIGSTVASGRFLYRFDGDRWISETDIPAGPGSAFYAYGEDVAVQSRISGGGDRSTLARYLAGEGNWKLSALTDRQQSLDIHPEPRRQWRRDVSSLAQSRSTGLAIPEVFPPTANGDFLTAGDTIFRRLPDGTWSPVGSLPVTAAKLSLQNRAPEYLAFEDQPGHVPDTKTTVYLLANGSIADRHEYPGERIMPDGDDFLAGMLAGQRAFVTYPAGEPLSAPTKLYLHRILNHSASDGEVDHVAASARIDTGYESSVTRYVYDPAPAVFDNSGEVVQYPKVTQLWCDSAGRPVGGRTESTFYNGLPEEPRAPALAAPASPPANAGEYYSLLAGCLRETRMFDADGLGTAVTTSTWAGLQLQAGGLSPVGVLVPAVAARIVTQTQTDAALELFPLPGSVVGDFDRGVIPPSVRTTFADRGFPLDGPTTVATVIPERVWRIEAGARAYSVRAHDDGSELMVHGAVSRALDYTYDTATGNEETQRIAQFDSAGALQVLESRTLYAWQVPAYAGMKATRMLTNVAERRTTNITADRTRSAIVTTYAEHPGPARAWASEATWVWRGRSPTAPAFEFAPGKTNPGWLKTAAVTARNEQGQPLVETSAGEPTVSSIYDTTGYHEVASISNVTLSENGKVASYLGFETYEALQGWTAFSRLDRATRHGGGLTHRGALLAAAGRAGRGAKQFRDAARPGLVHLRRLGQDPGRIRRRCGLRIRVQGPARSACRCKARGTGHRWRMAANLAHSRPCARWLVNGGDSRCAVLQSRPVRRCHRRRRHSLQSARLRAERSGFRSGNVRRHRRAGGDRRDAPLRE